MSLRPSTRGKPLKGERTLRRFQSWLLSFASGSGKENSVVAGVPGRGCSPYSEEGGRERGGKQNTI